MIKADWRPWKVLLNVTLAVIFLAVVAWIATGASFGEALLGACVFVLFWGGITSSKEFRRLQRAEQRRQGIASGKQWFPLASPQPYPDPEALPLPFVISKKPGWSAFLFMPILIWLAVVAAAYIFFWSSLWPKHGPLIHALALTFALTLAISTGVLFSRYHWIEVDVDGLTIRNLFWSKSLLWHEARLFAIDAAIKANEKPDRYELSSPTTILRWSREHETPLWTRLSCPFEEYTWQMKALHSVIAARTGLPLYDLRDGVANAPQVVSYPLPPPPVP